MPVSLRSALTAGLVGFSATAITFTSVVTPTSDISPTRTSAAVKPFTTVDLLAAQRPAALRELSMILSRPAAQLPNSATSNPAAITPTIAPYPGLIDLANWIDNAYLAIEPWVEYGFDVAAYVVSWIPWVGWIIDDQITIFYDFFESLVASGVFNTTDWLRGQGSAVKNIADWFVDLGLAFVWLGLDELSVWIPLPPLPWYPPRPPAADLQEGVLGDLLVGGSQALANVSNAIWDIWDPIEGSIDNLVGVTSDFLDTIAWIPFVPLINFQMVEGWELIAKGVDAVVGFAQDMINAGNQFVIDTFHGDGLIAATINATDATLDSIALRGGEAIQAWVDWGGAQIDYFVDLVTPGAGRMSTGQPATLALSNAGLPATLRQTLQLLSQQRGLMGADATAGQGLQPATPHRLLTDIAATVEQTLGLRRDVQTAGDDSGAKVAPTGRGTTDDTSLKATSDEALPGTTAPDNEATDEQAAAPDRTAVDTPRKDGRSWTAGLRKGIRQAAKDAANGDPERTANTSGADRDKSADSAGAEAGNTVNPASAADAPSKDRKKLTGGWRKGIRHAAKDADNGAPDRTAKKAGAETDKTAKKAGARGNGANKKATVKAGAE